MPKVFQTLFFAATHGFNLDSAKPRFGDEFVDDIKATLFACRVLYDISIDTVVSG